MQNAVHVCLVIYGTLSGLFAIDVNYRYGSPYPHYTEI